MADEFGYERERTDALKKIAVSLESINQKLEKVIQKRVSQAANKEYWVVVTETRDVSGK